MKKALYVTFMNDGWQVKWFILCYPETGNPITDTKEAKRYLHEMYPGQYWGIADKEQMKMNNAMQDNI